MATSRPAYNIRRLTWIARILVLASAVGLGISSYVFYDPHYTFTSIFGMSQHLSHAIFFGGSLMFLAGLMWFWPGASSIIALWWVFLWLIPDFKAQQIIPLPLYIFLYGMFIVGSIMHLITDILREKAPRAVSKASIRVRWAARILSLVSLAAFAIVLTCIGLPYWFLWVFIHFIPFVGIAWVWSLPGGFSIILWAIFILFGMRDFDVGSDIKMSLVVPWLIFLVSGVLYLISAWMQRRQPILVAED